MQFLCKRETGNYLENSRQKIFASPGLWQTSQPFLTALVISRRMLISGKSQPGGFPDFPPA